MRAALVDNWYLDLCDGRHTLFREACELVRTQDSSHTAYLVERPGKLRRAIEFAERIKRLSTTIARGLRNQRQVHTKARERT